MKFKIDEELNSSTDTDCETAIDIVKNTIIEENYILETLAGSKLSLEHRQTLSSSSYIEPDFDFLEKTGSTVYVNNQGETSHSEHFLLLGKTTDEICTLNDEQFQEYFKKHYYKHIDELDTPELQPYYKFKYQQEGLHELEPNYRVIPVTSKEILKEFESAILDALKTKPDNKGFYEVAVPDELIPVIQILDNESFDINNKNANSKINTNVNIARNDINKSISTIGNFHKSEIQEAKPFDWGKKRF